MCDVFNHMAHIIKMNRLCDLLVKRLYCSQTAAKSQSSLAILRKKTGFAIGKCREALTKHNENIEAAERWLYAEAQKEGWAKVEKLKDRAAHQGLIGILVERNNNENKAVMVEVCLAIVARIANTFIVI